jgi:hypothetical protein
VRPWLRALAAAIALALSACVAPLRTATPPPPPPAPASDSYPTKGLPGLAGPEVRDSVYQPMDRASPPPAGYGLYTVLLARSPDRVTLRLLSELFTTTGSAAESAIPHANLNLITIPVKKASEATRMLASARNQPDAAASALMLQHYDFGEAALLMASVCQSEHGRKVSKACGSPLPDGPLLVTGVRPLQGLSASDQRLLVVNLGNTPPDAVREVLAAYRRQILRSDFTGPGELDGWRLWVLDHVLDAANLLPVIRKAYATNA